MCHTHTIWKGLGYTPYSTQAYFEEMINSHDLVGMRILTKQLNNLRKFSLQELVRHKGS